MLSVYSRDLAVRWSTGVPCKDSYLADKAGTSLITVASSCAGVPCTSAAFQQTLKLPLQAARLGLSLKL